MIIDIFPFRSKLDVLRKEILEELGEDDEDLENKMPEPEIAIENGQIYIKRPWIQEYLFKRSKSPLDSANKKHLTEEEKLLREMRRKRMEIERRKALKRALRRAKMERMNALAEEGENVSVI